MMAEQMAQVNPKVRNELWPGKKILTALKIVILTERTEGGITWAHSGDGFLPYAQENHANLLRTCPTHTSPVPMADI